MATHRIKSLRRLGPMAVVVGAFGLAACGGDDPGDMVEVSPANRPAQLTEAERYELPGDVFVVWLPGFDPCPPAVW
jgi:hypothetical protein